MINIRVSYLDKLFEVKIYSGNFILSFYLKRPFLFLKQTAPFLKTTAPFFANKVPDVPDVPNVPYDATFYDFTCF